MTLCLNYTVVNTKLRVGLLYKTSLQQPTSYYLLCRHTQRTQLYLPKLGYTPVRKMLPDLRRI